MRNLNTKSPPQVGAKAHAIVKTVKAKNVEIMITCRPYASERGPNSKGPTTYPTRYIEMGRISAVDEVMWKCALMKGMALEGSEEPIVLLTTTSIPIKTIAAFRFCPESQQVFRTSLGRNFTHR